MDDKVPKTPTKSAIFVPNKTPLTQKNRNYLINNCLESVLFFRNKCVPV